MQEGWWKGLSCAWEWHWQVFSCAAFPSSIRLSDRNTQLSSFDCHVSKLDDLTMMWDCLAAPSEFCLADSTVKLLIRSIWLPVSEILGYHSDIRLLDWNKTLLNSNTITFLWTTFQLCLKDHFWIAWKVISYYQDTEWWR